MDEKWVATYIDVLRSQLGFRALFEAGAYSAMHGSHRGQVLTVQHESRLPVWKVMVQPPGDPGLGFFLVPNDGNHGWLEILFWGGAIPLDDPGLDARFTLRSRSKARAGALFGQPTIRSLLHTAAPRLYSARFSESHHQLGYHDQPGPPREVLVQMLDHALTLVASLSGG